MQLQQNMQNAGAMQMKQCYNVKAWSTVLIFWAQFFCLLWVFLKMLCIELYMVGHICGPSTCDTETGGSWVWGQPGLHSLNHFLPTKVEDWWKIRLLGKANLSLHLALSFCAVRPRTRHCTSVSLPYLENLECAVHTSWVIVEIQSENPQRCFEFCNIQDWRRGSSGRVPTLVFLQYWGLNSGPRSSWSLPPE
jgi:hypothetical protein